MKLASPDHNKDRRLYQEIIYKKKNHLIQNTYYENIVNLT